MIEAKHVQFCYHNDAPVLKDVSFTLEKGESLCVLGPNGTGKTTLFRCVINLHKLQGGKVLIDGKNSASLRAEARARLIAYVPQASALTFPYTVRETVLMGRIAHQKLGASPSHKDKLAAEAAMERLDVLHMAQCRFHELSGGERQLVLVARALAQQAEYLVLDEPTSSLDYANQIRILQVIKHLASDGYAILMTSHLPDQTFLAATRVLMLKDGLVFACGAPEATVTSQNLSALYGLDVCVTEAQATFAAGAYKSKVCIPSMP
ncbi:MAG: ABC transporter ATP-binding protein [Christensenellaceae bacterium]|jgi:iron complex transport system ATP-binding protein|nr:ABC transporter ATP-binding protein [Christensenellaceae bacterium]